MKKRSHRSSVRVYVFHHSCIARIYVLLRCCASIGNAMLCDCVCWWLCTTHTTHIEAYRWMCAEHFILSQMTKDAYAADIVPSKHSARSGLFALSLRSHASILHFWSDIGTHTQTALQCARNSSVQCIVLLFSNFTVIFVSVGESTTAANKRSSNN